MKELMLGNKAVARGLFEAGVKVISSYPGTPSTEITEFATEYDEIYSEWAPNEKVAFEVAFGAATGGARSFCAMKHVGLNVAADPLYTASYIGVNGGMVCAVADDPGMHSSQNEQDSRHHAIASKTPMLEPSDSAECKEYTKLAFELSEKFDTPFLLRLTTRISHGRSLVELEECKEAPLKDYKKDVMKNVMMPAMARLRHLVVEKRMEQIRVWSESSGIHKTEYGSDNKIGIICSGTSYTYAKEVLGDKASYLKLGMVNPLPIDIIKDFADKVEKVYVIEELDDIIEAHCLKNRIDVIGKMLCPTCGEFSQNTVRQMFLGESPSFSSFGEEIPNRPPLLCAGCPHRGLFYALKGMDLYISGDIGCYTLGSQAPLSMIDTCVCMGASIGGLHGYNLARGNEAAKKSVAVIGDSTFIHSGITGLIDITYNKGISTVIILDNSITGMTGHQNNPANGLTIKGDPTVAVDLEALAKACGIKNVHVVDPLDIEHTKNIVKQELLKEEPSLIIARRPCVLLKYVERKPAMMVDEDKCTGCKACLRAGCPAISLSGDKNKGRGTAKIDKAQCTGCEICAKICNFDSISFPDEGGN